MNATKKESRFELRMCSEIKSAAMEHARESGQSLAQLVNELLEDYLTPRVG